MDKTWVSERYEQTIGRAVAGGSNPLCHVRLVTDGGRGFVDIHLSMRRDQTSSTEKRRGLREAVKNFIGGHLDGGETMKCWLAFKNDPRVSLRLRRGGGVLRVSVSNEKIAALIEHWCTEASVSLS